MAVNETIGEYSASATSNTPAGTDTVGPDLDDHLRDIKKNIRVGAQHSRGSATPANSFVGMIWADSSVPGTDTYRVYDGSQFRSAWAVASGVVTWLGPVPSTGTLVSEIVLPDGSSAAPAARFQNATNSGLALTTDTRWGMIVNGGLVAEARTGALHADIVGNLTGNVVGNTSGNHVGNVTLEAGDTLDASSGTVTFADDQISGDKISSGTISNSTFKAAAGTVSVPTLGFASDNNTGFYSVADGRLGVAINGVYRGEFDTNGWDGSVDVRSATLLLDDGQIDVSKITGITSPGLVKLETKSLTGSSVNFETTLNSTYFEYWLVVTGAKTANSLRNFGLRFKQAGVYVSSNSYEVGGDGATPAVASAVGATMTGSVSTDAQRSFHATIKINDPSDAGDWPQVRWDAAWTNSSADPVVGQGVGQLKIADDITGIQLSVMQSHAPNGTFTDGSATLYGFAK